VKKIVEEKRFYCNICNFAARSKGKLKRHQDGYRHQLKYQSFLKYGDDWKKYYLIDNKKRYNMNRKLKN